MTDCVCECALTQLERLSVASGRAAIVCFDGLHLAAWLIGTVGLVLSEWDGARQFCRSLALFQLIRSYDDLLFYSDLSSSVVSEVASYHNILTGWNMLIWTQMIISESWSFISSM